MAPPIMIAHPQRPFMPLEYQTANTSGILQIRKGLPSDPLSHTSVTINGRLLEPLWRPGSGEPRGNRIPALNFNKTYRAKILSPEIRNRYPIDLFEMGHLWGPGFGDEAFAGMMWVPYEVNQYFQSQHIEKKIRDLYEDTQHGLRVDVMATVDSWNEDNQITEFAREIGYSITVDGPDSHHEFYQVNIEMEAPGSPKIKKFSVSL